MTGAKINYQCTVSLSVSSLFFFLVNDEENGLSNQEPIRISLSIYLHLNMVFSLQQNSLALLGVYRESVKSIYLTKYPTIPSGVNSVGALSYEVSLQSLLHKQNAYSHPKSAMSKIFTQHLCFLAKNEQNRSKNTSPLWINNT